MPVGNRQSNAELVAGIIVICAVVGMLSVLYSEATGTDRLLDGLVGAVFALAGIGVWIAVASVID